MALFHMLPLQAATDGGDVFRCNPVVLGDRGMVSRILSDSQDLRGRQFGRMVAFAVALAFLVVSIFGVILACAQKEMRRIHTSADIAGVAHTQAIWDHAMCPFPRETVGSEVLFFKSNYAITERAGTHPQPTTDRATDFINTAPESLLQRELDAKHHV
jgi:hypothetical protein